MRLWRITNRDVYLEQSYVYLASFAARLAAMLLLTLRGTPTLYQGDEIGIGKVDIPPGRIRDPQDLRQPGLGIGRDRSRTPMPWDASDHAGFSTVEPWLPLNDDWRTRNVHAQEDDPASLLSLYRMLLAMRRAHPALYVGSFHHRRCHAGSARLRATA